MQFLICRNPDCATVVNKQRPQTRRAVKRNTSVVYGSLRQIVNIRLDRIFRRCLRRTISSPMSCETHSPAWNIMFVVNGRLIFIAKLSHFTFYWISVWLLNWWIFSASAPQSYISNLTRSNVTELWIVLRNRGYITNNVSSSSLISFGLSEIIKFILKLFT